MVRKTGKLLLIFGMIICILFGTGCGGSSKPKSPVVMDIEFEDSYSLDEPIVVLLKFGHVLSGSDSSDTLGVFTLYHLGSDDGNVSEDLIEGEQFYEVTGIFSKKYVVSRDPNKRIYNTHITACIPLKYIVGDSGRLGINLTSYSLDDGGNLNTDTWLGAVVRIDYVVKNNVVYFKKVK